MTIMTPERLIEWGKNLKDEKLRETPGSPDLLPQADLWRDGQPVALVLLYGDRDDALYSLYMAIMGYGADEVLTIFDAYSLTEVARHGKSLDDFPNYQNADLGKMFNSSDPSERALVTEALFVSSMRREGDEIVETAATISYDYDPKQNKLQWGAVKVDSEQGGGAWHDAMFDGLKDTITFDPKQMLVREPPPFMEVRFACDLIVTHQLMKRGCPVMYACKSDEEREMIEVTIGAMPGVDTKRMDRHG